MGLCIAKLCQASSTPYLVASRSASSATASTVHPTVKFDWLDRTTWSNPFITATKTSSITAVYLISPPVFDASTIMNDFIDLARKEHGVKRFVLQYGSPQPHSLEPLQSLALSPEHTTVEQRCKLWLTRQHQERHLDRGRRARLRRDRKVSPGARRGRRDRVRDHAPDVVHGQLGRARQPAGDGPGRGQGLLGVRGRQDTLGLQDGHRRVRALCADGRDAAERGLCHTGARAALVWGGECNDCALLAPAYLGALVRLVGLTGSQCADILTEVIGKKVVHVDLTVEELAEHHVKSSGLSEEYAKVLAGMDIPIKNGSEEKLNDVVLKVTGRKPKTFREFAVENKSIWL